MGRGWSLYENRFPVRNCCIVAALVSCFVFCFFNSLCRFLLVSLPSNSTTEVVLFTHNESGIMCVCVCFINEEQLSNQSTLFRLAPLGSNRKYSQDFLSLSQALKQDTSAGPAYLVSTSFTTLCDCCFANNTHTHTKKVFLLPVSFLVNTCITFGQH